jgi:CshA-type fibril repeat protein
LTVFPTDGQPHATTIKNGGRTIEVANHGTFEVNTGTGSVVFSTWPGRTGTVSVRYRIVDTNGATADGSLTAVVTAGGATDTIDAYQGTEVAGFDVLANDTPGRNANGTAGTLDHGSVRFPKQQLDSGVTVSADGRTLTFADGGVASIDQTGLLTFDAATSTVDQTSGGAAFYTARDTTVAADGTVEHHTYQAEAWFYGNLNQVLAVNDDLATPFNASVVLPGVLNDTDTNPAYRLRPDLAVFAGGDPGPGGYLAPDLRTIRYPGSGTWTISPDGSVLYVPAPGFVGKDFMYMSVFDDHGNSTQETLTVVVEPGPTANPNTPTIWQNATTSLDVLGNDVPGKGSDAKIGFMDATSVRFPTDGQPAGAVVSSDQRTVTVPGQGVYSANGATGKILFDPETPFTGTASRVAYSAQDTVKRLDGRLVHNPVTSTLTVKLKPVIPVALNNWTTTVSPQPVAIPVLANDRSGAASAPLVPTTIRLRLAPGLPTGSQLSSGARRLVVAGDGVFLAGDDGVVTFTPAAGFTGRVPTIGYQISDTDGTFTRATITVVVTPRP